MSDRGQFEAQTEDGYMVVTVSRERYFSVTQETYSSRRAYELGNGGACFMAGPLDEDEAREHFPDLLPIVRMHLADVQTGEPMHAEANAWFQLENGNVDLAMKTLRRPPSLPFENVLDALLHDGHEAFGQWVDKTMRPRWQDEADQANALMDEMDAPAKPIGEGSTTITLTLDSNLSVTAELLTNLGDRPGVGYYNKYAVIVTDGSYVHETTFGGSVADCDAGLVNAHEAAISTLHEMMSTFEHETARGFIESCGEEWDDLPADQREGLEAAEQAYDAMRDAFEANREAIV